MRVSLSIIMSFEKIKIFVVINVVIKFYFSLLGFLEKINKNYNINLRKIIFRDNIFHVLRGLID